MGVVLFAVALWLAVCAVIANDMLRRATRPHRHSIQVMRERQLANEHIDLDTYDNVWQKQQFTLNGLHGKLWCEQIINPADNGQRRRVAVICHGHTVNHINAIKYATIFYNMGFSIVTYDQCYFGNSEGNFTTLGYYERHDLSTVLDYTRNTFGQDCVIALHGESMGAVTVLDVLALRSDIDLVIADCPFGTNFGYYCELYTHLTKLPPFPVVEMSKSLAKLKFGYKFDDCNPIDAVKQSNVPICFIHGKDDDLINCHHSVDMYNVCNNPQSELYLVDGARHACSHMVDNKAYADIVKNFVNKVLD